MSTSICRPPTPLEIRIDRGFRRLTLTMAGLTNLLVIMMVLRIATTAWPAIQKYGLGFLVRSAWDPNKEVFGIWPQIAGTLLSSMLGLALGTIFGLGTAIVLSQHFLPHWLEQTFANVFQILASIPSVVYGLWGLFVVVPLLRPLANWIHGVAGGIPLFSTRLSGPGMLPAAIVLGIMVLPTIVAISREALGAVPQKLREVAYGMGATHWETILKVVVPTAAPGITGAIILAFGRAVGETMAVAMLIGNSEVISWSLFAPGTTLAALLANHFAEANQVEVVALMYASLVLLAITLIINILGEIVLERATASVKGV